MRQSVSWNRLNWDVEYAWADGGESWSEPWGGSEKQWQGGDPAPHPPLPAGADLSGNCARARPLDPLSQDSCDRLMVVDLSANCIAACRRRFEGCSHIAYYVNDGRSLAMIPDKLIDFVFSFNSLVHVEADVLEAYLQQLTSKLTRDGIGFIHHSNLGQYRHRLWYHRVPGLRGALRRTGLVDRDTAFRTFSVSAAGFETLARQAGLRCISQELVNWSSPRLSDCLSIFTRAGSRWSGPNRIRHNPRFIDEARRIKAASLERLSAVAP